MHSTAQPHAVPPQPDPEPAEAPTEEAPAGPDFEAIKAKAHEAIDRSSTWIRQNPAAAVGIAIASGFIVGRILRK